MPICSPTEAVIISTYNGQLKEMGDIGYGAAKLPEEISSGNC